MTLTPRPSYADPIGYVQTNLVSDITGLAATTDPNLVNPWGIAFGPTSPVWIADNGTGLSTLYTGSGQIQGLVVTIPPSGAGSPTGTVFNSQSMAGKFNGDAFLFASEDGTITGWRGSLGTNAEVLAMTPDAIYKGIAIDGDRVYATNFSAGTVDVFDSTLAPVTTSGGFVDPNLPSGYAPFNIENIAGQLYVTYAKQDADKEDDVPGPGNGFVDVFDADGNFVERFASNGVLNSPWGMALAPASFGAFGNDLLIGNFGDGTINAFDPTNGNFLGTLDDVNGNPIVNQGLWGLEFGNNGPGFDPNTLYFTAGIPGDGEVEDHGLFGALAPVPEPGSAFLFGTVLLVAAGFTQRRKFQASRK